MSNLVLDHFAGAITLDRAHTYKQGEHPFKPDGLWVSVRGEDDWESWCRNNEYGNLTVRHEVTLTDTANIFHIDTAQGVRDFYDKWRIPDDREPPYRYAYAELRPDYINWAEFTKTCDGIIIAPYQWSMRLSHMWYSGWDCASGCIWNLSAIATFELADADRNVTA